jgi:hypothetical protein
METRRKRFYQGKKETPDCLYKKKSCKAVSQSPRCVAGSSQLRFPLMFMENLRTLC